jgi:hypothetical protein
MSYAGYLTDRFCEELEKLLNHAYEAGVNGVFEELIHQAAKIANRGVEPDPASVIALLDRATVFALFEHIASTQVVLPQTDPSEDDLPF